MKTIHEPRPVLLDTSRNNQPYQPVSAPTVHNVKELILKSDGFSVRDKEHFVHPITAKQAAHLMLVRKITFVVDSDGGKEKFDVTERKAVQS